MSEYAVDGPLKKSIVCGGLSLGVRQTEQVAVRPADTMPILEHLIGELAGGLVEIPGGDRGSETAAPAAHGVHKTREGTQVSSGASHLRQRAKSGRICIGVREFR